MNVFLACGVFKKDRKRVTFNMNFYHCLPHHLKEIMRKSGTALSSSSPSNETSSKTETLSEDLADLIGNENSPKPGCGARSKARKMVVESSPG